MTVIAYKDQKIGKYLMLGLAFTLVCAVGLGLIIKLFALPLWTLAFVALPALAGCYGGGKLMCWYSAPQALIGKSGGAFVLLKKQGLIELPLAEITAIIPRAPGGQKSDAATGTLVIKTKAKRYRVPFVASAPSVANTMLHILTSGADK